MKAGCARENLHWQRQRANHVRLSGQPIQRLQKALELMNLKLTQVLGDVTGVTGLKIIRAIVAGARDPVVLAKLRDRRCQHSLAEIATALDGRYRLEHVMELKFNLAMWEHYQTVIAELDEVIARYGVPPEAVPDFIALRGDPSDGLPGAKGIGEKTAADLLRRHGTLEAAIDGAVLEKPGVRKALLADPDLLLAFKDIATLRHVAVELPPDRRLDTEGAAEAARALGMNRLAERLDKWG